MDDQKYPDKEAIRNMSLEEKEAFMVSDAPADLIAHARLAVIPSYVNARQTDKIKPLLEKVLVYGQQANDHELLANCYRLYGWYYTLLHQYGQALEKIEHGLAHARQLTDFRYQIPLVGSYGNIYYQLGMYEKALKYFKREYDLCQQFDEGQGMLERSTGAKHVGTVLAELQQYDEALIYLEEGLQKSPEGKPLAKYFAAVPMGEIFLEQGELEKAREYFDIGQQDAEQAGAQHPLARINFCRGKICFLQNQPDEALSYLSQAHAYFTEHTHLNDQKQAAYYLAEVYGGRGDFEQAYKYLKEVNDLAGRLNDQEAKRNAHALDAQLETERREKEFEVRLANTRLNTLAKITSEIAHEVQNPLQFVNNFSEMNVELVDELNEYLESNDTEGIAEVAKDITENSQKVRDYGVRISKIVDQLQEQVNKARAGELELDDTNEHDFS